MHTAGVTSPECTEPLEPATAGASRSRRGGDAAAVKADAPFELRGSAFTMMRLKVLDARHPAFFALLAEKVGQAPSFFRNAPIVLDLECARTDAELDLRAFAAEVRAHALVPVAVQGGTPEQQERAVAAGLALLPARGERPEPVQRPLVETEPEQQPAKAPAVSVPVAAAAVPDAPRVEPARPEIRYQRTTQIITEPVRSGRRIYAHDGDLVVTAPVSPGAELLADGSIHVYGALRGRALAGASGDANSRIFCLSLDAELVSIAGLYLVSEDIPRDLHRRHVQILVRGGTLQIEPITA